MLVHEIFFNKKFRMILIRNDLIAYLIFINVSAQLPAISST